MRRPVTKKISLRKWGLNVATAHIECISDDNHYLLVWDGPWVKQPPKELTNIQSTRGAKTLITTLRILAKKNNLKIQVRHPQDWNEFKHSMNKLSKIIGVEFVEDK